MTCDDLSKELPAGVGSIAREVVAWPPALAVVDVYQFFNPLAPGRAPLGVGLVG